MGRGRQQSHKRAMKNALRASTETSPRYGEPFGSAGPSCEEPGGSTAMVRHDSAAPSEEPPESPVLPAAARHRLPTAPCREVVLPALTPRRRPLRTTPRRETALPASPPPRRPLPPLPRGETVYPASPVPRRPGPPAWLVPRREERQRPAWMPPLREQPRLPPVPRRGIAGSWGRISDLEQSVSMAEAELYDTGSLTLLPPMDELRDAAHVFTSRFFQIGFLPRGFSVGDVLRTGSSGVFLMLAVLGISAGLTPSLAPSSPTDPDPGEVYVQRATIMAGYQLCTAPNLEKCQAFYLLGVAQQIRDHRVSAKNNMEIAMHMANTLSLHLERSYRVPETKPELAVRAESARRTFWMAHSHDGLRDGPPSSVTLATRIITALLPSGEDEFNGAKEAPARAALFGTAAAERGRSLCSHTDRSLFATNVQVLQMWFEFSGRALRGERSARPWQSSTLFAMCARTLYLWEDVLPQHQRWHDYTFESYKRDDSELPYIDMTLMTRLCSIMLRKTYLPDIIASTRVGGRRLTFWMEMSLVIFQTVKDLFIRITTFLEHNRPNDGMGSQVIAFSAYTCGFLACYLRVFPWICADVSITAQAPAMVEKMLALLEEGRGVWPLAARLHANLAAFSELAEAEAEAASRQSFFTGAGTRENPITITLPEMSLQSQPMGPMSLPPPSRPRLLNRKLAPNIEPSMRLPPIPGICSLCNPYPVVARLENLPPLRPNQRVPLWVGRDGYERELQAFVADGLLEVPNWTRCVRKWEDMSRVGVSPLENAAGGGGGGGTGVSRPSATSATAATHATATHAFATPANSLTSPTLATYATHATPATSTTSPTSATPLSVQDLID